MKTIYVVVGSVTHDKVDTWIVAAYPTKKQAKKHASLAQEMADKWVKEYRGRPRGDPPPTTNIYDQNMTTSWDPTPESPYYFVDYKIEYFDKFNDNRGEQF